MLNLTQSLRLEQRLTPQQILLSTLLQLPMLSLELRIKSELEMNPVLEEGIEEEPVQEEIESDEQEQEVLEEELAPLDETDKNDDYDKKELEEAQADNDIEALLNDDDAYEIRIPKDKNQEEYERPEISLKSLPEHLMEQLHILRLTTLQRAIGEYIIWNIRDDGYLEPDFDLTSVAESFETSADDVEYVLRKVQTLEPTGIGSRNLRECLLVQLEETVDGNNTALKIIRDHFDDFKNKHHDKILEILQITADEFHEALALILKLNPKPGESLFDSRTNYIIPDFIVEKVDDKFVVQLNDWNVPPLRISNTYKKMLMDRRGTDKDTRQYIRKKVESARWFISSIYQRKYTMLNVMEAIIEKQQPFFEHGPEQIRPLIMREIAEIIQMDISTVSRVANGKYVQTDHGVFELKYFFNERMETDNGEEVSTRIIKARLKEICSKENPKLPLSDDKIAEMLNTEGYPIARRTVAKYREQLQIPIARLRRGL